ncbi:glycine-rich domain-containing protein, partial [Pseudomonas lactis]
MGLSVHDPFIDPLGNPLGLARESGAGASLISRGEQIWTVPGTYEWVVPKGVKSICAVAIGGGGGRNITSSRTGGGGATGYANNIAVSPGQIITVVVGAAGINGSSTTATAGGDSYLAIELTKFVEAPGGRIYGTPQIAPTPNGAIGGVGSNAPASGGGGAGGYIYAGGAGASGLGATAGSSRD